MLTHEAITLLARHADQLRAQAVPLALQAVEQLARQILHHQPRLAEFVMGMGQWFFTDETGAIVEHAHEHYHPTTGRYTSTPCRWVAALWRFMQDFDDDLCLTGNPMRFTAAGPVITDW